MKGKSKNGEKEIVVAGFGASAGGLDPLKQFFKSLPEKTGMAFIVVVHLSPRYKSNLAELLQKHTQLNVLQVIEKTVIKPECVYVIPPNKLLSINENYLELTEADGTSRHSTVDLLFSSLGETYGEKAVAVILSGSGADGAEGIKVVKERGGYIIVQDPGEAEFSDMPNNAIKTGLADVVLPVDNIADELNQYRQGIIQDRFSKEAEDEETLQKILSKLHSQTGHDFSNYKQLSVLRRIRRRMHVNRVDTLAEYDSYLLDHPDEADKLFKNLLISVTRFFRDKEAFEAFKNEIIPKLFKFKDHESQLRIWVPGCATGEEAYTIAILLHEYAQKLKRDKVPKIQIFATDIDEQAIKFGRLGRYPDTMAMDVTPERLKTYFYKEDHHYQLKEVITEMVLFAHHDLLKDPPFSKLDMIVCRNLLIYFNSSLQAEVFKLFHYSLLPESWLFLGVSDSKLEADDLFKPVNKEFRLYKRNPVYTPMPRLPGRPLISGRNRQSDSRFKVWQSWGTPDFEKIQLNFLMNLYAIQNVIINEDYEVIYSSDNIQKYVEYTSGHPSLNILEMIKPELRNSLQSLLYEIEKNDSSVSRRKILTGKGKGEKIELQIHRLENASFPENYFYIVFKELKSPRATYEADDETDKTERPVEEQRIINALENELEYARDQVRIVLEQNKISTGKLRISNEELQSMNEELHSTAEELETSMEELHTVNDELKNLNKELERKIDELARANCDLKNLLEAIDIGILIVDTELCVQLFTTYTTEIFNLIPEDKGRPIDHIKHRLRYDSLSDDLKHILHNLESTQKVVQSYDKRWYNLKMNPYLSIDDNVEGVVLICFDITEVKELQKELKHQKLQESLTLLSLYAMERNDPDAIMNKAIQQLCLNLELDYILLFRSDQKNKNKLFLSSYTGLDEDKVNKSSREIVINQDWDVGYAIKKGDPVIIKNYVEEERIRLPRLMEDLNIVSGLNLKILGSNNSHGVLSLYTKKKHEFSDYELNYIQCVSNVIGMTIERVESNNALEDANKQLKKEIRKNEQFQREILNNNIVQRWELGSYLHDNLAQILASIKIMLLDIHKKLPDENTSVKSSITELSGIMDEALMSIRELTHDIIPIDIEEEGVDHAFRFLIRQAQKLHKIQCNLETDESIHTIKNRKLATNIYHVVQEAIKNAAIHGKAKNVDISVLKKNDNLMIRIKDDGIGLKEKSKGKGGKGLRIMKYRMQLLEGTFDIRRVSEPGKTGTIVKCTIPFKDLL